MEFPRVNIHTHRPTGRGIELRTQGVHPWLWAEVDPSRLDLPLPPPPEVQAVGEIGLDYARATDAEARRAQRQLLLPQLRWAEQAGLPVVLHCVRAFEPLMEILRGYRLRGVIFHGFIGSAQQAQQALRRGYYLSFGVRTFASPKTLRALEQTPTGSLFVETDEATDPIDTLYDRTARVLGIEEGALRERIYRNYEKLFGHGNG